MRIALFTDTFLPQVNGVANTVHRYAEALGQAGHEVRVFTVSRLSAQELEAQAGGKYTVHTFPSLPALIYPGERACVPFFWALRAVREFKPDILHTHTPFNVGVIAIFCARKLKIPLVGTHHTFFDHYLKHVYLDYAWARDLTWKLTVRYYNYCDLVTSPTKSLMQALKENGLTTPIELLHNILDTDFYIPATENSSYTGTMVYMGRLSYEKSVDDALRAAAFVIKKIPAARLLVIGDGPERATLERLAHELHIARSVEFTGYLHDEELVKKLQEAEVFITGSKSENMPLALLEAMAVGLPIVAVQSLGLEEMLKHEHNALLVAPGKPQELASAMLSLLENEELRTGYARNSRTMSLEYSAKNVIERLIHTYQRLSARGATPGAMAGRVA